MKRRGRALCGEPSRVSISTKGANLSSYLLFIDAFFIEVLGEQIINNSTVF